MYELYELSKCRLEFWVTLIWSPYPLPKNLGVENSFQFSWDILRNWWMHTIIGVDGNDGLMRYNVVDR